LSRNWQQIIWREWRHCLDPDYAEHLFDLVADEPAGWGARLNAILFNIISGAALAVVGGAILTFDWAVLQHFAWAGGFIGGLRGYLFSRGLSWRSWLERLSASTPTSNFSRVIFSSLLLGLMGGMIFGPIFWLLAAGLFWGFGDLIRWLNRELAANPKTNLGDRQWWFWWRGRPYLFEVEAALQQACIALPPAQARWSEPLHRLTAPQGLPALPDRLVADLLSKDWVERFVACHRLVSLGREAVPQLMLIAEKEDSPLQQTALWLLRNIEHMSAAHPADLQTVQPKS
jgi:hypothetical protein